MPRAADEKRRRLPVEAVLYIIGCLLIVAGVALAAGLAAALMAAGGACFVPIVDPPRRRSGGDR